MAVNPPLLYGVDLACIEDASALFGATAGIPLVRQDAIHRLTTDSILGPGGDDWGYNVSRLLGMPVSQLPGMQPILSGVLTRDPRVDTADVRLTPTRTSNGTADVLLEASCGTALGPFSIVAPVSDVSSAFIEGQAPT